MPGLGKGTFGRIFGRFMAFPPTYIPTKPRTKRGNVTVKVAVERLFRCCNWCTSSALKYRSELANCLQFTLQIYVRLCCRRVLPWPMIKSSPLKTTKDFPPGIPFKHGTLSAIRCAEIFMTTSLPSERANENSEPSPGGKFLQISFKSTAGEMLFWHEASSI